MLIGLVLIPAQVHVTACSGAGECVHVQAGCVCVCIHSKKWLWPDGGKKLNKRKTFRGFNSSFRILLNNLIVLSSIS